MATDKYQAGPRVAVSDKSTKRYSKRIILVFIIGVGLLIAAITMQAHFSDADNFSRSRERERTFRAPHPSGFAELAAEMRRDRRPVQVIMPEEPRREPMPVQRIVIEAPRRERRAAPRYYSNRHDAQAANMLRTMRLQALTAEPIVENFELIRNERPNITQRDGAPAPNVMTAATPSAMDSSMMAALMQQPDPNRQADKIDFLRSTGGSLTPQGFSVNIPVPQQFPYELKAGTIIPGIMMTGINSDLPGNVIAQVSENVWDTATGRHVLIPKGTRVLGVYDSQVTFGQRRVLLVWNRLVFPNGTTLDISGSPGVDQAGFSGLSGRVNEHWGRMVRTALLTSAFAAGAEMIYGSNSQGMGNQRRSPSDVAAESVAGSVLDMGARMMNRASNIQPTITIRPGKRMGIFVQRDIVFPHPYF